MMGADLFETLHVSFHHLAKLLIFLIFSAHKAPLSLIPSRQVSSCIKIRRNMPLEKKSCFLIIPNRGRLTSHSQLLTNVFSQSPTHSPSRKMWFRNSKLSAGKPISKAAFFHSSFYWHLPFFSERRRRRKKPTQQQIVQNQFYSFLASFTEKSKGMWDCFTLGMLEKDLSHSGTTLYLLIWTEAGKGRKKKGNKLKNALLSRLLWSYSNKWI